eukprot:350264-Chlamydomonas_euryale.AAC.6
MSEAREPRRVEDVHELGQARRRTHLSCRVEGAIQPSDHACDPAKVSILGADEGQLPQLLVHEAAGLQHNLRKRWGDVDVVQQGSLAHAAWAPQCRQKVFRGRPCRRPAPVRVGVLRRVPHCHEAKVGCLGDPSNSLAGPREWR